LLLLISVSNFAFSVFFFFFLSDFLTQVQCIQRSAIDHTILALELFSADSTLERTLP
jgi:hypothetical protein